MQIKIILLPLSEQSVERRQSEGRDEDLCLPQKLPEMFKGHGEALLGIIIIGLGRVGLVPRSEICVLPQEEILDLLQCKFS